MTAQNTQYPSQTVERLEQWRASLALDHRAFAALLGRDESEWSRVRRGVRRPSRSLVAVAIATAAEPWRSALEKAYLADLTEKVPA